MRRSVLVALLIPWLVVAAPPAPAASPPPADPAAALQKARTLQAAGDDAQAVPLLQGVIKDHPDDGQAWLLLAASQQTLRHPDLARAAFLKAAAIDSTATAASRGLFLLLAGAGKADQAWPWFRKLADGRQLDLTALALQPEVAQLRDDARFAMLFPNRIRYEPPFAEDARVIHEWRGERPGDEFGWIARDIGDVDHDGVDDAVVSAPAHAPQGDGAGTVYVYSSRSGQRLWKHRGPAGSLLGNGVEAAGDVDGDGTPDVVAGAPGSGTAYVLSGRDGSVLRTFKGHPGDQGFGTRVTGLGDFDGDGRPELAVSAPGRGGGRPGAASYAGRVYVYSGRDGHLLLKLEGHADGAHFGSALGGGQGLLVVGAGGDGPGRRGRVYVYDRLVAKPAFVEDADPSGAALGAMFVSVAGDANGDGVPDVYASDWADAAHGPGSGRIYLYSGKDGKRLLALDGSGPGEGFGTCAARTGDVDGDGLADLAVGSWQYGAAAWSGGRVAVYSGKDGRLLESFTGKVPGDTLGFDAVGIGDVDHDGRVDFLVTSAWSMVHGIRSGRVYIVAGRVHRGPAGPAMPLNSIRKPAY